MPLHRGLLIGGEEVAAAGGRPPTTSTRTPAGSSPGGRGRPERRHRRRRRRRRGVRRLVHHPPTERRRILNRAADLLEERAKDAATLMAGETGGTYGWSMFNVGLAANMFREAAALTTAPVGEVLASDDPARCRWPSASRSAWSPRSRPGTRRSSWASARSPRRSRWATRWCSRPARTRRWRVRLFVADVLRDAGLPPGVLNVLTNDRADAAAVAETLIGDRRVRRVNFTGSTGVGRRSASSPPGTSRRPCSSSAARTRCWCSTTPTWSTRWTRSPSART